MSVHRSRARVVELPREQFGDSMRGVHPTVDLDHTRTTRRANGLLANGLRMFRDARPASTLIRAGNAARIIPPHPSSPRFT